MIADLNSYHAYAIYNKGRIINHFNNYNFPTQLTASALPQFDFVYKREGDFSELWFNAGNDRQVVVVKRNTWFIEAVTLFAYLFCSFLLIIFVFHIGALFIKAKFKLDELIKLFRFNIRTQIQATIIFVSVFSFLVIGLDLILGFNFVLLGTVDLFLIIFID